MSWALAATAMAGGASYFGAMSSKSTAIRNANSASKAEGEAIARERLNTTVRNAYSTALAQMNLAAQKQQYSQNLGDISAAERGTLANVDTVAAASGSVGGSVDAVASDIRQRAGAARASTQNAWEAAVTNYNNTLDMMVVNTDQSAPQVRPVEYHGPSDLQILGTSLLAGAASFGSNYAMGKARLGGTSPNLPSQGGYDPWSGNSIKPQWSVGDW